MSFVSWYDAGFTDIIPVVPPDAKLAPSSQILPTLRGKVPGVRREDGLWTGLSSWLHHNTTREDCVQWDTWYSGYQFPSIGLRAQRYPAIDIDVSDPQFAEQIERLAVQVFGETWVRWRDDSAKRLLLYTTEQPFGRMRLWFAVNGKRHLVEILGKGNQYLVEGQHPNGSLYVWSMSTPQPTKITRDAAEAFFDRLREELENAGCEFIRTEGTASSSGLRMYHPAQPVPFEQVAEVVAKLPNTDALFPTRNDYLRVGYAIKASVGEAGLPLWLEWGARWENDRGEANDLETMRRDWSRMHPPFAVGFPWLLDKLREAGAGPQAEDEFSVFELPVKAEETHVEKYSDAWIVEQVLRAYGNSIRYCKPLGGWLVWKEYRWVLDTLNLVPGFVAQTCLKAGEHALTNVTAPKTAKRIATICASNNKLQNVLSFLTTVQSLNVAPEKFDSAINIVNTPAGVVDLRTGMLTPPDSAWLLTKSTSVAPSFKPCPNWQQFLHEITQGDTALQEYLARLAGYALTGNIQEHIFVMLWGPGGNGKSVFLNTLCRIFGSYATVSAMETFTTSRNDRHPTELAMLRGSRLVTAQETQEDRFWDEAKIKSITGGDIISARFMRQDFFSFRPQFVLVVAGNHRPHIRSLDQAMRRRVHLVPFLYKPPKPNLSLAEVLAQEDQQILGWVIRGAQEWFRVGLRPPASVVEATEAYFDDQDAIGRWMAERLELVGPGTGSETQVLFNDWRQWCREHNEYPGSERNFSSMLAARGFNRFFKEGVRITERLALRAESMPVVNDIFPH